MKTISFKITFQITAVLIVSLLFVNCNNKSSTEDEIDIIAVEFPEKPNNNLISENLTLSNIVALETVDASLIKHIKKIIRHNDKLIILNAGVEVLIFDKDGKFLHKINKRGNGPNEYTNIVDISMDDSNGNIIVYSDNYKLLFFDLVGNYVSQVNSIAKEIDSSRILVNISLL